jgi:hypothetical protein
MQRHGDVPEGPVAPGFLSNEFDAIRIDFERRCGLADENGIQRNKERIDRWFFFFFHTPE